MTRFFSTVDKLKPAYDITYKVVLIICKLLLIGDILITSMSVLGRYIPFIPDPSWSEEVVLTFMSYMAVLSAALAIRRGAHIRMTAFDRYLPNISAVFPHAIRGINSACCWPSFVPLRLIAIAVDATCLPVLVLLSSTSLARYPCKIALFI